MNSQEIVAVGRSAGRDRRGNPADTTAFVTNGTTLRGALGRADSQMAKQKRGLRATASQAYRAAAGAGCHGWRTWRASLVAERLLALAGRPTRERVREVRGTVQVSDQSPAHRQTAVQTSNQAPLGAAQEGSGKVQRS